MPRRPGLVVRALNTQTDVRIWKDLMRSRVRQLWMECTYMRAVPSLIRTHAVHGRMTRPQYNTGAVLRFLSEVGHLVDETPEEGDMYLTLLFRRWFVRFLIHALERFWMLPVVQELIRHHPAWEQQITQKYEQQMDILGGLYAMLGDTFYDNFHETA